MAGSTSKEVPKFKVPKTLGECADRLFSIDLLKSKANRVADLLDEERIVIENHLKLALPKIKGDGVSGKKGKVRVYKKDVPQAFDWAALEKHIKKTGEFDLLQRRLSGGAVVARWEKKKKIPGVKPFQVVVVSVTKA